MKEQTEYFVGIDISQKELEVAVKNAPIHFTETNTSKGIENLVERCIFRSCRTPNPEYAAQ